MERIRRIWQDMRLRCNNPKHNRFYAYGERGITVCKEWDDFETFRAWAMLNGYDDSLTIDRIDNEKGYAPENCRWADQKTQQNNRTNNRILEVDGVKRTMTQWANIQGVDPRLIHSRLKMGWDARRAVLTPKARRNTNAKV